MDSERKENHIKAKRNKESVGGVFSPCEIILSVILCDTFLQGKKGYTGDQICPGKQILSSPQPDCYPILWEERLICDERTATAS